MKEEVLVTGGAGFIGSQCCKLLAGNGYTPICFDNLSTGSRRAVSYGPLIVGDIRDRAALNKALE
ncbi:MAG: hypothetical protein CMM52_05605 [Rhodospirillaceae bacterium]|nr:hypothetical protein [Rhodospirillaceae bacterium]